ncbi:MAG TPA: hypothetical protein ENI70_00995 [Candidatus Peregrinibacteria bacterium]|nr:hypothetical protein [Candidatus Peregrinibacteria bacterium]
MPKLTNLSPKKVIQFLLDYGFEEIRKKSRGRGDHRYFYNKKLEAFTQVDTGKRSLGSIVYSIIKQSKIDKSVWKNHFGV